MSHKLFTLLNSHQVSCNPCLCLSKTWESRKLSYKLSLVNSHAALKLVLVWPGHESWNGSHSNSRFSTLINFHATLVLVWPGHESWENSHTNSRFSTLMQLLFLFDQNMRVKKTLIQTLACQHSCNSCSCLTRTWELRKPSYKLSLVNTHATLALVWPGHESWVNSYTNSRLSTLMQLLFLFDQNMRVKKTLIQTLACQHSCNSCSCLTRTWELRKPSYKLSLVNTHATLALVWPGHESWVNSYTNSRLSTLMQLLFLFDQNMRVKKTLIQTLACQHSCNSCSCLTRTWELRKLSYKLSLVNTHATLALVWPGHESWENSHTNSRFSTLMQLLFLFDQNMRVKKTLIQTLASQHSCNSCSCLTRTWELRKPSYKLSLLNSHATLALVWPGHESWVNSHTNSRLSTLMQLLFLFDQNMRVEKTLIQTLACQHSCSSCSRLTTTWGLKGNSSLKTS